MFTIGPGFTGYDTLASDMPTQGEWRDNSDGTKFFVVRLFNDTGAALTAGRPYVIKHDGDEEKNPKAAVPAALAAVPQHVVVATENTADQAWGWFVIQGYYDPFLNGDATDIAKDDYLKIVAATSTTAFVNDTTTRTVNSFAISTAAETDATASRVRVYLFGNTAIVS